MRPFALRRLALPAAFASIVLFDISCGNDSSAPSPTPTDVIVSPGADTLISLGQTRTFAAQVLDANGHPIDAATVTWSSTAPGILSIDPSSGVATAVANGTAQVKATKGAIEGSANVIVAQIVASVTVTPGNAAFTAVGDTVRFTAVAKDAGNSPVVGVQILWSINDNTVATIDTLGLARSKGPGTALVSAQAQTRAGYAAIGVAPTVTQIAILAHPDSGVAGDPNSAALQVELRDANGQRVMDASLPVNVSAAGTATGTTLHGTTSLITDQGRATFAGLWFERSGADRLKVVVGALPADSGVVVTVRHAAPALLHSSPLPVVVVAGVSLGFSATLQDRFGNTITEFTGPITVAKLYGPPDLFGQGPLVGDSEVTAVAGVATFPGLNIQEADPHYRLTAIPDGLPVAHDSTPTFEVRHGPPWNAFPSQLGGIQAPRGHFGDTTYIVVSDAYGNAITDTSLQVHISVTGWPYSSPFPYDQKIVGPDSVTYAAGVPAPVALGVSRPGRVRMIFSVAGGVPDTLDEAIAHLPQAIGNQFAATYFTTCVWSVFCSGSNAYGVLGVDSLAVPTDSLFVLTDAGGNPAFVDGGAWHLCTAYDESLGTVRIACRGWNSNGQLGGGSVGGVSESAVLGPTFTDFVALSAGGSHTCAIGDGVTLCWGWNEEGQLGSGSAGGSTGIPTLVTGGHTFVSVSAGGRHTCAVDDGEHLWCWGANDRGQLGDSGLSGTYSAVPVEVYGGASWSLVSAGEDFTCAYGVTLGGVACWGNNDRHQLGPTSDTLALIPVPTLAGFGEVALVTGQAFACYSGQDGPAVVTQCWGANEHGQLGRGFVTPAEGTPMPVLSGGIFNFDYLNTMVAGLAHVCGKSPQVGPRLICWGANDQGQFGDGNTKDSNYPVLVDDQY